jgi:hypothetical protein
MIREGKPVRQSEGKTSANCHVDKVSNEMRGNRVMNSGNFEIQDKYSE